VKGAFGLRPASPLMEKNRKFSLLPRGNKRPVSRASSSVSVDGENVSLSTSAKALFLGDLASLVDKE